MVTPRKVAFLICSIALPVMLMAFGKIDPRSLQSLNFLSELLEQLTKVNTQWVFSRACQKLLTQSRDSDAET